MTQRKWTAAEEHAMREHYSNKSNLFIGLLLGRTESCIQDKANKMGLKKSPEYLSSREMPNTGRFKPGHTTWNKGTKGRCHEIANTPCATRFKAGQINGRAKQRYQPIGAERITDEGYRQVKISDEGRSDLRWKSLHIIEWEAHHGPVPAGTAVVFKNGNKQDYQIGNLELITRAELMRRNTIHRYPRELKFTIKVLRKLEKQLNEKR